MKNRPTEPGWWWLRFCDRDVVIDVCYSERFGGGEVLLSKDSLLGYSIDGWPLHQIEKHQRFGGWLGKAVPPEENFYHLCPRDLEDRD